MPAPDFARTDFSGLTDRDVQFLIENFPKPGRSYEEIAALIHELPPALESRLNSQSLFDRICDPSERILQISPFLFFQRAVAAEPHRSAYPGRPAGSQLYFQPAKHLRPDKSTVPGLSARRTDRQLSDRYDCRGTKRRFPSSISHILPYRELFSLCNRAFSRVN